MAYVNYQDIINQFNINKGDIIFISSDVFRLAYECFQNGESFKPNLFINTIQEKVGAEGSVIFPTYNWGFCQGHGFDYWKTPCETGTLGQAALTMKDFRRTKHPIYSFAVWGKDRDYLCDLNNISSFGADSPFAYFQENNVKNLIIGVDYKNCFTYVHYVEEQVHDIPYRYLKNFCGDYIDDKGSKTSREYAMFVRNLDLNVENTINPIGKIFEEYGIAKRILINGIDFVLVEMGKSYPIIEKDIRMNRSRNICTYTGQEDDL